MSIKMKCRKCRQTAAVNMRHHRLALCAGHYITWIQEQTERFIKKYRMFGPDDRVLVAVSGGKDSLALWDVLDVLGYRADGLYIGLGIDGGVDYSNRSRAKVEAFVAERPHLKLTVVDVAEELGAPMPAAADLTNRGKEKPCSVCGMTRRHIMNRAAHDGGYDVLATGHNLDDEAATLLGNTLSWQVGYLARQYPVLPADAGGLARKVKPFFRFYERDTAAYTLVRGIDYMYDECPYSVDANSIYYKEILNRLETDRPGTKLQFFLRFLHAKETSRAFAQAQTDVTLNPCPSCGQPTANPAGPCTFCRTWEQVRERLVTQVGPTL
ncbi:MAG: adenine nucleotide alpha hydrolase family protein [Anaerolineae bacterium]|nr:adenine nucleotide alpha hydrolase family protein [Anaerolineae bacterium]